MKFLGALVLAAVSYAAGFSANPTLGWKGHSDVSNHFPEHPAVLAHHWCKKIDERLTECQLYDGDAPNARLVGFEPIVPAAVWRSFSARERALWHWHKHSHTRVVIPGASAQVNERANRGPRSDTYGKTVLLWDPAVHRDPTGTPQIVLH